MTLVTTARPAQMLCRIALGGLAGASANAFAHEGHGLLGSHWHATDALGFMAVAAVAALAVWWSGK